MKRLKTLLGLLVLVVVIYTLYSLTPVYLAKFQFQDELANIAKYSADHSEDQIHDEVMKKAQDLGVPAQPENVHVVKDSGRVTITTHYTVTITPPVGKPWVLTFDVSSVK